MGVKLYKYTYLKGIKLFLGKTGLFQDIFPISRVMDWNMIVFVANSKIYIVLKGQNIISSLQLVLMASFTHNKGKTSIIT